MAPAIKAKIRTVKFVQRPTSDEPIAVIQIRQCEVKTNYHVQEYHVSPEMGIAGYRFSKDSSDEGYDVLLCNDSVAVCDCMGHTSHGKCKHADLIPILYPAFRKA